MWKETCLKKIKIITVYFLIYLLFTILFTAVSCFLQKRVSRSGGAPWEIRGASFQTLAGRVRSGKDIPGAGGNLGDGSEQCGVGRQASGEITGSFCCGMVTELTETRPGSKSLPGGAQQARRDLVKALKTLLLSFV